MPSLSASLFLQEAILAKRVKRVKPAALHEIYSGTFVCQKSVMSPIVSDQLVSALGIGTGIDRGAGTKSLESSSRAISQTHEQHTCFHGNQPPP